MKYILVGLIATLLVSGVVGDCYMHYMRGSNNRLNEAANDVANQNRLFDSQNNDDGGYHWGPSMTFYVGSVLSLEHAHQHSCGMGNLEDCNMVYQYMCEATLRDGDHTQGANGRNTYDPANGDQAGGNAIRGRHETGDWYNDCAARERNKGLFVADQNLNDNIGATSTRQNAGGTRYGTECPEERDYYPYWHPSPWKDIAVTTHNSTRCAFYQAESQNVINKGICSDPQFNNAAACSQGGGTWSETGAWGVAAPDCVGSRYSRDNHNGVGATGFYNTYNWTIPNDVNENCVLRMRYNISVGDYDAWNIDYNSNGIENSPVTNDPAIDIGIGNKLQLALNTAQTGRTFEDRSHKFSIAPMVAPAGCVGAVQNIGVRGHRGNNQQVYPAIEYDFTPQILEIVSGGCVHFHWTGSDYNQANRAGEGTDQTDRSNVVQQKGNNPKSMYPEHKDDTTMFTDESVIESLALLGQANNVLNDAPPDWDEGVIQFVTDGDYNYLCTRNNNFTNRAQRGTLNVGAGASAAAAAAIGVGVSILAVAAGLGGAAVYARTHPSSRVAAVFNRRGSGSFAGTSAGPSSYSGGGRRSHGSRSRGSSSGKGSRGGRSHSKSKGSRSRSRGSR